MDNEEEENDEQVIYNFLHVHVTSCPGFTIFSMRTRVERIGEPGYEPTYTTTYKVHCTCSWFSTQGQLHYALVLVCVHYCRFALAGFEVKFCIIMLSEQLACDT